LKALASKEEAEEKFRKARELGTKSLDQVLTRTDKLALV
jgi:hypothetical protein